MLFYRYDKQKLCVLYIILNRIGYVPVNPYTYLLDIALKMYRYERAILAVRKDLFCTTFDP